MSTEKQSGKNTFVSLAESHELILTSVMLSSIFPIVSLRFNFAFSMASSLTKTASILDTMLPMECSMRSTLRESTVNSSYDTPLLTRALREDLVPLSSSSLSSPLSSKPLPLLLRAVPGRFAAFSSMSSNSLLSAAWKTNNKGKYIHILILPMLRQLLSKIQGCKDFCKPSKPYCVGIH